jgi:hypothetical protein
MKYGDLWPRPQFEARQLEMMIEAKDGPDPFAPHQRER